MNDAADTRGVPWRRVCDLQIWVYHLWRQRFASDFGSRNTPIDKNRRSTLRRRGQLLTILFVLLIAVTIPVAPTNANTTELPAGSDIAGTIENTTDSTKSTPETDDDMPMPTETPTESVDDTTEEATEKEETTDETPETSGIPTETTRESTGETTDNSAKPVENGTDTPTEDTTSSDTFEDTAEADETTTESIPEPVENTVETITQGIEKENHTVNDTGKNTADTVNDTTTDASGKLVNSTTEKDESIGDLTGENPTNTSERYTPTTNDTVDTLIETTRTGISHTPSQTDKKATANTTDLVDTQSVENTVESTKQNATQPIRNSTTTAKHTTDTTTEIRGTTTDATPDSVDNTTESIGDTTGASSEAVLEMTENTTDPSTTAVETTAEITFQTVENSTTTTIRVNTTTDTVENTTDRTANTIDTATQVSSDAVGNSTQPSEHATAGAVNNTTTITTGTVTRTVQTTKAINQSSTNDSAQTTIETVETTTRGVRDIAQTDSERGNNVTESTLGDSQMEMIKSTTETVNTTRQSGLNSRETIQIHDIEIQPGHNETFSDVHTNERTPIDDIDEEEMADIVGIPAGSRETQSSNSVSETNQDDETAEWITDDGSVVIKSETNTIGGPSKASDSIEKWGIVNEPNGIPDRFSESVGVSSDETHAVGNEPGKSGAGPMTAATQKPTELSPAAESGPLRDTTGPTGITRSDTKQNAPIPFSSNPTGKTAAVTLFGVLAGAAAIRSSGTATTFLVSSSNTLQLQTRVTAQAARQWFEHLPRRLPIPGYSRHDDSDPLENNQRSTLWDAITSSPGENLGTLVDQTNIPRSTVRYHLRILEHEGLVTSAKLWGKLRVYPIDTDDIEVHAALSDGATLVVLKAIGRYEPASGTTIAKAIDRDISTVTHHLHRLDDIGLIERERNGKTVVNRLTPTAHEALGTTSRTGQTRNKVAEPGD